MFNALFAPFLNWADRFVREEFREDVDRRRHARLIVNFGIIGGVFGFFYTSFYLLVQNYWGAGVVFICTISLLTIGFGRFRSLNLAGNLLALTMNLGFIGLAWIEGGVEGHAVGWLATVPISALVLASRRSGVFWFIVSVCGTFFFAQYYYLGGRIPFLYPAKWHPLITTVGYISLTLFVGLLGFIIESGRRNAFQRMELAMAKLSEVNASLRILNKEKTDMMQVVAHDLRSPLQTIMGHAALISEGFLTDPVEIQASGGQVVKTSRRMSSLITNLLDLNAIEEGNFTVVIADVNLREAAAETVLHHTFVAQNKGITILWEPPLSPIVVRADIQPLSQVLDNLLSNAVKYSPKNSTIRVFLEQTPTSGIVHVADKGPGLSAEDQSKLFQKFTRLSSRPTGGEPSSGLGLSIARKMTESMGGKIFCTSELGSGSQFSIELPLAT